ncbi:metaxin 1 [Rhinolophus ferrumequinum]|uniref:Metaxin 1 n=1 Tax=Rhinolophus ferrumequinum TaxID=59479 RepID=A0A7J7SY06_RHIFE|nr:metaxin 1 [Rhinolophus ferrumequinum]
MCPLCNPGIESHSGPGWRHLGSPPHQVQTVSSPPLAAQGHSIPPLPLCCSPASLDAFVFSYLVLLLQAKLPSGKLQAHLRGLPNLCAYCTHILSLYFPWDGAEVPPPRQTPAGPETEEEPYGRRNQILSVLAGLAAMAGYALLSGIVSIQRAAPARTPDTRALGMAEEDEEE